MNNTVTTENQQSCSRGFLDSPMRAIANELMQCTYEPRGDLCGLLDEGHDPVGEKKTPSRAKWRESESALQTSFHGGPSAWSNNVSTWIATCHHPNLGLKVDQQLRVTWSPGEERKMTA
ncbi:hypothetical protein M406DRAFT_72946 [Cryphonectria parasitica EP155]|uniref:Uncharacterized protein n=1 Tax=Cryphonectria parasitica (strain ATCC 38755 / EP155) TaxID=660469 RepID=A0A9P4XTE6_CRYP1|nr:uncharacterized protein M406DRAFT_72946 [Cryphonectria parasitica EP155]KAF3760452.1 hypothetical protein M406DRAFT_72946 [Cryphonectria parasitica EP155]